MTWLLVTLVGETMGDTFTGICISRQTFTNEYDAKEKKTGLPGTILEL